VPVVFLEVVDERQMLGARVLSILGVSFLGFGECSSRKCDCEVLECVNIDERVRLERAVRNEVQYSRARMGM
jgi:hypothetical protein